MTAREDPASGGQGRGRTPADGQFREKRSQHSLKHGGDCVLGRGTCGRRVLELSLEGWIGAGPAKEVGDQAVPGSVKGWMEHIWKELETRLEIRAAGPNL